MPGPILVPTDGSPPSRRAVREAAALAGKLGARLIGLHVMTPFETIPRKGLPEVITAAALDRQARKSATKLLSAVANAAARRGVACRCHAVKSLSASAGILAAAKKHRCAYIVIGTHGRRGVPRLLLGSVTRRVLARSPVPVLVCR